MHRLILVFAMALLFSPSFIHAAGFENSIEKTLQDARENRNKQEQTLIGKQLWAYFDRRNCNYFFSIQSSPTRYDQNKYASDSPKQFRVEEIVPSQTRGFQNIVRYFKVRIEDGTIGFIETTELKVGNHVREFSLKDDCVLEISPDEVRAAIDKIAADRKVIEDEKKARFAKLRTDREAQEEAERKESEKLAKKPAARIGMTAAQVLENTSWGKPESINKTITASGVGEQWVYGLGQYLYFRNGRLVAIQKSD